MCLVFLFYYNVPWFSVIVYFALYEEMIFLTPELTYPFCEEDVKMSLYKKVILVKAYLGKNLDGKDNIINSICTYFDSLFEKEGIEIEKIEKIYVLEDILFPYTIYFEERRIHYTALEIASNSFFNKRTHTENDLFGRSIDYFRIAEKVGAFDATGKYCSLPKCKRFVIIKRQKADGWLCKYTIKTDYNTVLF